ncbi:hypothetical protein DLR11_02205 [Salmonella enterica subsp. salamae]|uniref:Uncharacterized protein n=1 Tax=Salmonella enterica subsp. salamae serovar 55:k:z39 str. 1315K TaxID=1243602 RepID=A0A6C7C7W3_SALER|nr:hypothetical protein LFZ47_17265 [Salmonella enterica subsp. salamae serovar 55:k:z39 str. 1315K]ECG1249921.1 hypothetical protein [Salmonella enterica subsp. salamae]ECG1477705.1 hypothetical protein [Salmonella enterica subsp. salamae]ECI3450703.1 hypothetical protein [Salmonella enterica subsp. salamae]ECI4077047.1 hypothetical protein [Salmonella enterica subsp. salamae]
MVFKCFMVLSFLINLIAIPAVGFSCLIDLMWGICNDRFLYAARYLKHFYYICGMSAAKCP